MTFEIIIGLLLTILFSVVLERIIRNPFIVAGIFAVITLIIFAIFFETLTAIFAIWVIVYTIAAFVAASLTDYFTRRHHGRGNRENNDDCF